MRVGINIDNTEFNMVCGIERVANVTPSEISGMLLDKTYFNDIIGTYLRYTITIAIPYAEEANYAGLYELLTDPVADHRIILPYNQSTVEIVGRIESVSDSYVKQEHRDGTPVNIWRRTKFDIIANHPTKEMTLEEVIARGISPLPDVSELDNGKIYMVVDGEWVMTSITRADENYY